MTERQVVYGRYSCEGEGLRPDQRWYPSPRGTVHEGPVTGPPIFLVELSSVVSEQVCGSLDGSSRRVSRPLLLGQGPTVRAGPATGQEVGPPPPTLDPTAPAYLLGPPEDPSPVTVPGTKSSTVTSDRRLGHEGRTPPPPPQDNKEVVCAGGLRVPASSEPSPQGRRDCGLRASRASQPGTPPSRVDHDPGPPGTPRLYGRKVTPDPRDSSPDRD